MQNRKTRMKAARTATLISPGYGEFECGFNTGRRTRNLDQIKLSLGHASLTTRDGGGYITNSGL
jgi:hypothetical protein